MSTTIIGDYTIRTADKNLEVAAINDLLDKYFHPEETILKCLISRRQPTADELAQIREDQHSIIGAMIANYPCLVAVHTSTGEIVGVNVMIASENPNNVPAEKRSVDVYKTHAPKSDLLADYFDRMNAMIDEAELLRKFSSSRRLLEFYAVAVSSDHRRKGLGTALMEAGLDLAGKDEVDVAFGLFTSPHSKKSAETVGMLGAAKIDLMKYEDEEGKKVFEESKPHNEATVMACLTALRNAARELAEELKKSKAQ